MKIMFLLAFCVIVFVIIWCSIIILFGEMFEKEEIKTITIRDGVGILVFLGVSTLCFLLCMLAYIQMRYILKTHIELHSFISQFKKDTDRKLSTEGPGCIFFHGAWLVEEDDWWQVPSEEDDWGTWQVPSEEDDWENINVKWENIEKAFIKSTYEGKINAYEEMESLINYINQISANWKLHKEVYKCIRNRSYDAICEMGKLNRSFANLRQLGYHYGRCYAYYEMLIRMENFMYVISILNRLYSRLFDPDRADLLHYNIEIALERPYFIHNNIVHPQIYKPPFRLNRQKWHVRSNSRGIKFKS